MAGGFELLIYILYGRIGTLGTSGTHEPLSFIPAPPPQMQTAMANEYPLPSK